ncbi:MAG TPA: alkaline phosphatase family protein [Planctomycetota bacterium]|nr:alkaline phosphatase family protein [Planctomycetota bacterium]
MSDIFVPYERVVILALDSVCWNVLLPLVADNTMPALGSFLRHANYGVLESTVPPHTAAAWTSFLTGKDPGRHGVIDFVKFDPSTHSFRFHDSSVQRNESILYRLSKDDISCGSIFLPRNYPPYPLKNGYIISGFETPNTKVAFTEPEELRDDVLGVSPHLHFNFEDDWEDDHDDAAFQRNVERARLSVDLLERIAVHCQRERPVAVQIAYLQATDILFHKAWKWCDPDTCGSNAVRREAIKNFFRRIDQLINRVFGLHSSSSSSQRFRPSADARTLRVIVSDHGHGSSDGRVFINNLLQEWGYLTPLNALRRASRRITLLTMNADERKIRSKEIPVDWSRTKAYLAHVGIYGFVYINLKGREPNGIVAPEDFDKVRSELINKFLAQKIPGTDMPLFPKVYKGEELYARKQELNLPDLIVAPADGFYPRKKLTSGNAIRVTPKSVGGVHRSDGVYAFEGPDILAGQGPRASITDIAPTLLAALGQPVPSSMTGKAMLHLWGDPPSVQIVDEKHSRESQRLAPQNNAVYSKEEEQAIEKRLADLGYLE